MLLVDQYQENAIKTAIYPIDQLYPSLGLVGECAELTEALLIDRQETEKEMGDCLWYIANLGADCGRKMSEITCTEGFYNKPVEFVNPSLTLFRLCGMVAENMKKAIRDNEGVLTKQREDNVVFALRGIYNVLLKICNDFGLDMEEVARKNNEKLFSRMERGKLGGDGNDR